MHITCKAMGLFIFSGQTVPSLRTINLDFSRRVSSSFLYYVLNFYVLFFILLFRKVSFFNANRVDSNKTPQNAMSANMKVPFIEACFSIRNCLY